MPNHCECGHHYAAHTGDGGPCLARTTERRECDCVRFRHRGAAEEPAKGVNGNETKQNAPAVQGGGVGVKP